jgi:hypothetical protein
MLLIPITIVVTFDSVIMFIIYSEMRKVERLIQSSEQEGVARSARNNSTIGGRDMDDAQSDDACEEDDQTESQQQTNSQQEISIQENCVSISTRSEAESRSRSRLVARQGVLYIVGYLVTVGPTAASAVVFLITGDWNRSLDRASYFFFCLQGVWNFLIYSRRRQMKTAVGRTSKTIVWGMISGCGLFKNAGTDSRAYNSARSHNMKKAHGDFQRVDALGENTGNTLPPTIPEGDGEIQNSARFFGGILAQLRHDRSRTSVGDWRWEGREKDVTTPQLPRREASRKAIKTGSTDLTPNRPLRIQSEKTTFIPTDSDTMPPPPTDFPPLRPLRVESEVNDEPSSADIVDQRMAAFDCPPPFETSEIDPPLSEEREDRTVHQKNATMSPAMIKETQRLRPPSLPVRLESEAVDEEGSEGLSQVASKDPLERKVTLASEQPPVLPLRFESEVDTIIQ